jgi:hypothetical protein
MPRGGAREGAGRKPTGKNPVVRRKVNMTIHLYPSDKEKILNLAAEENKTISKYILDKIGLKTE